METQEAAPRERAPGGRRGVSAGFTPPFANFGGRATRRSRRSGGPNAPPMNPFGAATGLGKANASVDSADGTADALARVEVGASSSAGSSVPARSGGVAAAGLKPAAPKKGLMMRMPRAHLGTTPMKFSFQAQDLQVTLSTVGFEGRLVLAFKRGNDRRETEPMQLKEEVRYALRGHRRTRAHTSEAVRMGAARAVV